MSEAADADTGADADTEAAGRSWRDTRELVLDRDGYACRFCEMTDEEHREEYDRGLEVHHVIPRADGGDDTSTNLLTLCISCHRTLEHTHAKALQQLDCGDEGELARAVATYAVKKSWAKADAIDADLGEFIDGHPTFRDEFALYRENREARPPCIESHRLRGMLSDVSSEWAFLVNWGYKQGLLDVAGGIENWGYDALDEEALAESDLPDPADV